MIFSLASRIFMEKPEPDAYALDSLMTFKKLPKEKLKSLATAKV